MQMIRAYADSVTRVHSKNGASTVHVWIDMGVYGL